MMSKIEITDEMVDAYLFANNPGLRSPYASEDTLTRLRESVRSSLSAVAPLIAAAEREACAKVAAEAVTDFQERRMLGHPMCAPIIAAAIRARSS